MKHLSIKFLLLTALISHLPCLIQAGRQPAGKRSPAQQQQYLAQQNRLRQAQLSQQEAARKEKEAQAAAALAAQQEIEQEKAKQETSAVAPISAEPTIQPQQPATQLAQPEAQPQDTSNQAEAIRYAQARAMQKKQAPMSLWRLAYLQIAPTAISLLFKAFQEGLGTTMGGLIKGLAKRRSKSIEIGEMEKGQQAAIALLESPKFLELQPKDRNIIKGMAEVNIPSLPPMSNLTSQAFYNGMLSGAGSILSALIISIVASGLQSLIPTQQYAVTEE